MADFIRKKSTKHCYYKYFQNIEFPFQQSLLLRFMRTLREPLLTEGRRQRWMEVSQLDGEREKMKG